MCKRKTDRHALRVETPKVISQFGAIKNLVPQIAVKTTSSMPDALSMPLLALSALKLWFEFAPVVHGVSLPITQVGSPAR